MNEPPLGFSVAGVFCVQSADDPLVVYCVPDAPRPDVAVASPAVSGLPGGGGLLVMEVAWLPPRGYEDAVSEELARRDPTVLAGLVEVRMAPPALLQVDGLALTLASAAAPLAVDPFPPPHRATLTARLDNAQAAVVDRALLQGTPDVLWLEVRWALQVPVLATARLFGDVLPELKLRAKHLPKHMDDEAAQAVVDAALASGALAASLEVSPPGEIGRALADEAMRDARQAAALVVEGAARQLAASRKATPDGSVQVSASRSAQVRVPAVDWNVARCDVGAWLAARRQSA